MARPGPRPTDGRWRAVSRHSRVVDVLRLVLPATAILLVALVVAWPYLAGEGGLITPMYGNGRIEAVDPMRMQSPRYVGHANEDRPYEVRARSAVLDPAAPDRIELDALEADVVARLRELHVEALVGVYHRDDRRLELGGGIDLTSSDGYRLRTERAVVDLERSQLSGDRPVAGEGPAGTLEAGRFEIEEGGEIMRFEDRVRVIFRSRAPTEPGT